MKSGLPKFTSALATITVICFGELFRPDHSVDQGARCFANFWPKDAVINERRGIGLHLIIGMIVKHLGCILLLELLVVGLAATFADHYLDLHETVVATFTDRYLLHVFTLFPCVESQNGGYVIRVRRW